MNLMENMRIAWEGLCSNKMRSLLTMLGIIIGITSVIAILTAGDSVSSSVTSQMGDLGSSNITIMLQQQDSDTLNPMSSTSMVTIPEDSYITEDMITAVRERYPDEITGISYSKTLGSGQAKAGKDYANVSVSGISADYLRVNSISILVGRGLDSDDLEDSRNIAVVSDKLVNNMYDGNVDNALGERISLYIDDQVQFYTIIGVYEYDSSSSASISSEKDIQTDVYIPLTTARQISYDDTGYTTLTIASSSEDTITLSASIQDFMNRYYKNNDDYAIMAFTMDLMLDTLDTMLSTISLALSLIAGISLLVGGIGVMNIMLVSVTERTKEIGTRKALGATSNQIRIQFVVESMIVCLIGGAIGLVLGAVLGYLSSSLIGEPSLPSISSICISVGFSLAIGLFFGYYPANKAAQLNPIDALRYE